MNLKRVMLFSTFSLALLGLGGCASTCEDACNSAVTCVSDVGLSASIPIDKAKCISACEDSKCDKKQEAIDCVTELSCSSQESLFSLAGCAQDCQDISSALMPSGTQQ